MNVWFIQQHRSDQDNTSILIYSTREGAEKAVHKYIKDYLSEGYDFKDFYGRTKNQCLKELNFDDGNDNWIAGDKIEADHGQIIEVT